MPDWAFHRHSSIHASMHVQCPGPCCITKSILHVHVHVACSCQCCIPCECFMSISMSIDIYIEMPECWTVRHLVSPVPDWKNLTDAGVSFLDADAQLWKECCSATAIPQSQFFLKSTPWEFHFRNFRHIFGRGVAWNYIFFYPQVFFALQRI
jgi:hypothetical protein